MTPISVLSSAFLSGPSIWARTPVLVQHVRIEAVELSADREISIRVQTALAGFVDPESQHTPRDPLDVMQCDSLAALLAGTSVNLQRLAGFDVEFWNSRVVPGV